MLKKTHRPFLVAGQGVLPAKRMFYWLLYHLNMLKHMTSNLNRMQEYAEFYLTKHKSSTLRRTAERLLCAIVSTADRRPCWMTVVFRKRLGTTVTCKRDAKIPEGNSTLTSRYLLNLDNLKTAYIYLSRISLPSTRNQWIHSFIHGLFMIKKYAV